MRVRSPTHSSCLLAAAVEYGLLRIFDELEHSDEHHLNR
jgi:hypothetical protein